LSRGRGKEISEEGRSPSFTPLFISLKVEGKAASEKGFSPLIHPGIIEDSLSLEFQ
jgi:hypothetical protein